MSRVVVYKYELDPPGLTFNLPVGSVPLVVAWQNGSVVIWVQHEIGPDVVTERRTFEAVATDTPWDTAITGSRTYVGSAVSDRVVFHVYEVQR